MPTKNAYDIIRTPLISEKGVSMMEDNKYCFKVAVYANKHEIKNAVEEVFKVEVHTGNRAQWKKAIVTLKEGHKIEVFEGA
jgi:large subunit ribosomal protein L23